MGRVLKRGCMDKGPHPTARKPTHYPRPHCTDKNVLDVENMFSDIENGVFDAETGVFDVENNIFDVENVVFNVE